MGDELKPIVLTFGYGINRRSRPQDIDIQECYDGENFDLSHQFFALHRRDAFGLVTIAPNGQEIRGFAQLVSRDGTVSTLIQAGGNVYHLTFDDEWTWTLVGTVLPTARLRGPRSHNWLLDQYVVITDLEKQETVKSWDGSTFGDFANNLGVSFYAKFCRVHGERIYFGNVKTGTVDTPHVILASKLSDGDTLTTANRPASSLSNEDAFFLPTPDLRPVNGVEKGFGQLFFSTSEGQLHRLSGSSAKDFELISFYEGSSISGDEALLNIGNDILMGLQGRIETLAGTLNFGDVETDDASQWIKPLVENVREWTFAYNRRLQKIYCLPDDGGLLWVLHKSLLNTVGANLSEIKSPWSKWTTEHDMALSPSAMWSMIDPQSNLELVFFGDAEGRLYAFEGGVGQDGAGPSIPNAVEFDGTADYLLRGGALTGAVESSDLVFSLWINPSTAGDDPGRLIYSVTGHVYVAYQESTKSVAVNVANKDSGRMLSFITPNNSVPLDSWSHILCRVDTNAAAGLKTRQIYVNDVNQISVDVVDSDAAFLISFDSTNWGIGVQPTGTVNKYGGCLSEFWFAPAQSLDLTTEANRRLFIDANKRPVRLGLNGEVPTGTSPLIYLKNAAESFEINFGTGGDFTPTGMLADCETNPSGAPQPADITVSRRSKIIDLPALDIFDVDGWILYQKAFAATVTLTFEYGGTNVFDQVITIRLPGSSILAVYNGSAYYNGSFYYNAGFSGRLNRQKFSAAGNASHCQVKVEVSGAEDIEIHELGLNLSVARDN